MDRYIKFEPSKEPLYDGNNKDCFYLFKEDMLMVKLEDEKYTLPRRENLEKFNPEINHLQCLGAFDGINCYCGEIKVPVDDNYSFIDLRTYSRCVNHDEFLVSSKALLLLEHERANQKCGLCGNQMKMKDGGNDRAMICTNCGNMEIGRAHV